MTGKPSPTKIRESRPTSRDEELVWAGRPDPDIAARYERSGRFAGTVLILFDVTVVGVVITNDPGAIGWMVVAFLLLGTIGIAWREFSKPIRARSDARRTLYAITDRRCIIVKPAPGGGSAVESFAPGSLDALRSWRADPGGDVLFTESGLPRHSGRSTSSRANPQGFFAVPDPEEVERLIRQTLLVPHPEPIRQ